MSTRFTSAMVLFLACVCGWFPLAGQELAGHVTDAVTGKPIPGVALMIKGTTTGTASDAEGFFRLSPSEFPAVLVVSHLSYATREIYIRQASEEMTLLLEPSTYRLKGAEVKPFPVAEVLKERYFEVLDYEFLGDELLLLANRNGSMFRPCLILTDIDGDTICTRDVSKPDKLYRDFEGKIYFISRQSAWLVQDQDRSLALEYVMDKEKFLNTYPVVVDMKFPNWILRQYKYQNQALDYYLYGENEKQYDVFCSISNKDAIARSRWGPYFDGTEADEHFGRVIINRPVFAPMFRVGDSLVVINYIENRLEFYDNDCNELGHTRATFMNEKGCKEEIYKDDVTGKLYALFLNNGISSLHEISLKSGSAKPAANIPGFVYVDKISIHNNEVFFLYREKINQEVKRMYRMKI